MSPLEPARRLFYEANGYLVIRGALSREALERARAAAGRAEARWRAHPDLPGCRDPHFEQIEAIMEYDEELFDLVEHPSVFPLARAIVGDDIQIIDHAYYMTAPGGTLGRGAWHTDTGRRLHGVHHPRSTMMVRVIYALEDVPAEAGPTLVLPGSHRYAADVEVPVVTRPEDMPGHVAITCRAGDAYLYNGHLLHAPSHNTSERTRRVLLFNYGHRWMRMWRGHEASSWLVERARTPIRQQLIGHWRAYYGEDAPYGQ